nr:MAG: replication associated protein [Cressdnaviricota sp.]
MKSRNYCFTCNNYTDDSIAHLDTLACRYLCYGKEIAPGTHTPHLQGYIVFQNPRAFNGVRALLPGCHLEIARGTPDQCIAYCSKDGDFHERGNRPKSPKQCGDLERARWVDALQHARDGSLDEIDPQILVCHYGTLRRIEADYMVIADALSVIESYWFVGDTGSGKSRGARLLWPDLYPKPLNKWWDCYESHETVLLDDVDPGHGPWLGSFLKIWSDHYSYIGEAKGRSRPMRPKRLLVTSQYSIGEVFAGAPGGYKLVDALTRRFTVIPVIAGQPIVLPEPELSRDGALAETDA